MASFAMYVLIILVVLVSVLLAYMKWSLSYWKRKNVPYLEGSLLFGNLGNPFSNQQCFIMHFQEFYNRFKRMGVKCGGVYAYCVPILVCMDPEYNKLLLVKDFQSFHARGFYSNEKDQPISANLFTVDGDKWRTLRGKITPIFTSAKIKGMFKLLVAATKQLDKYVEERVTKKSPLNVRVCATRFTADIIGACAFGINYNSFEDPSYLALLMEIMDELTNFIKISLCIAFPNVARCLRVPLYPPKKTDIVYHMINDTIKQRREQNIHRDDFLQLLIEMMDSKIIDIHELCGQCLLFFLGGYETSATTITYLLFELACNQDIQQRLRYEINEVLKENGDDITYDGIINMKYLDMVLCETLRKYPPVPFLQRKCVEEFKLPNSDIVIEKGTTIIFPIRPLQYDPEYYPDPEKFDPERFSIENRNEIIPYTWMPFGEGPRNCIGDRLGKQQVKIGVISLLRKYRFKLNSEVKLPLVYKPTIHLQPKHDILLDVEAI